MKHISLNDGWMFSLNGGEARPVALPHDFSMDMPKSAQGSFGKEGGWFSGGYGVYRREFERPDAERVFLQFDGCMGLTEVYVNNNRVCFHPYGYMPFRAELTPYLTGDEINLLEVRVNTLAQPAGRWYTGSGLFRDVEMLLAPRAFIPQDGIYVKTEAITDGECALSVSVEVEGGDAPVALSLFDPDGKAAFSARAESQNGRALFSATLKTDKIWSDEAPNLWRAEAKTADDSEACRFGIVTVRPDKAHGLLINNRPVKLRGGCLHHDNGMLGACSYADSEERRLSLMKAAGFNAVRTSHNPPSRAFLEACDKLGVYVLDEAFDVWRHGKVHFDYHLFFEDHWEQDLRAMVHRDRAHPCVAIWSNGNEIAERGGHSNGYETMKKIDNVIREMDARPVTHAFCSYWDIPAIGQKQATPVNETMDLWAYLTAPNVADTDIAGYNYDYDRIDKDKAAFPERTFLLTETFPMQAAPCWKAVMEHDFVSGDFVWTAWDYMGESGLGHVVYDTDTTRGLRPYPFYLGYCGDFNLCGLRRPQSYLREIVWGLRQEPFIGAIDPKNAYRTHAVSRWGFPEIFDHWYFPGEEGKKTQIYVYADADEVELTINGVSFGAKAPDEQLKCVFDVVYTPGTVRAMARKRGKAAAEAVLVTCSAASELRFDRIWRGKALVYADVSFRDQSGSLVPLNAPVALSIENGEILASANGSPIDETPFSAPVQTTACGRATTVVKNTPGALLQAQATVNGKLLKAELRI